ncbi:MAG: NAD-dependent epimerase/dehydratase family protein [Balneolaceae bacterium]|nr:NAD-dependent epimerase/dehydratase family protein [Balneolaceae bacterium]
MTKVLVTGACGQLGTELTSRLRSIYGVDNVIASDISDPNQEIAEGPFEHINVLDKDAMADTIRKHGITEVYHLAALLSAKAEQNILPAWKLNVDSLLNILELAKEKNLDKIFWPSSIAVFGPDAPSKNTPQNTALNPTTVYGISKMAGEQWCAYYHRNFGVDVRSLRYPGLIGYKSLPGGGTTDYAVDIHYKAIAGEPFSCFLDKGSYLPMMYMDDAIKATIQLMQAEESKIEIRTSYNLSAISFAPEEIAAEIQNHLPDFEIAYEPDYRQKIADSWPDSIDDTPAREQWGWNHDYDLKSMVTDILANLPRQLAKNP